MKRREFDLSSHDFVVKPFECVVINLTNPGKLKHNLIQTLNTAGKWKTINYFVKTSAISKTKTLWTRSESVRVGGRRGCRTMKPSMSCLNSLIH